MNLNISKLIQETETIINDEQIGFASKITRSVQEFVDNEGNIFELSVSIELKNGIGDLKL